MEALKISIRSPRGILIIGYDEIMYCMGDGRYTRIFLQNGESHLISKVLRRYESLLPKDFFFRIHKSSIVNLSFIKEYCSNNGKFLVLTNNEKLFIAKRRCKFFLEKLLEIYPS
jgi:two-component system, LytTR family, response regulator